MVTQPRPYRRVMSGLWAPSRSISGVLAFLSFSFSLWELGESPLSSCLWEGPELRAQPRPLSCFVLLHKEPLLGILGLCRPARPGGAPAHVISAGKQQPGLAGPLWAAAGDVCWTRAFQAWSRRTKAREEGGTKGFFTRQLKSLRLAPAC